MASKERVRAPADEVPQVAGRVGAGQRLRRGPGAAARCSSRRRRGRNSPRRARALFPRWHAFILTGLLGGPRWGETAALRVGDVDWARGRLHVQRTVSDGGRRVERTKDHDDRWVKASPALLDALREHLDAVGLEGQVKGWNPEQRLWVFPTTAGTAVEYSAFLKRVWRPLLAQAGLAYRRYHATRHTFATWLLSDGADIRWVQRQLGHASIARTADTYGHVQPERHEAAAAGLDRYLSI